MVSHFVMCGTMVSIKLHNYGSTEKSKPSVSLSMFMFYGCVYYFLSLFGYTWCNLSTCFLYLVVLNHLLQNYFRCVGIINTHSLIPENSKLIYVLKVSGSQVSTVIYNYNLYSSALFHLNKSICHLSWWVFSVCTLSYHHLLTNKYYCISPNIDIDILNVRNSKIIFLF